MQEKGTGCQKERMKRRVESRWEVNARRGADRRTSIKVVGRRESKSER